MNVYAHARRYLVIAAAVPSQVNEAFLGDIVNEPADLVSMGLYNDLVFGFRINYTHNGAVSVYDILIDIRLNIVQPNLLTSAFKTGGRRIIKVFVKEFRGAAIQY